jgi:hypothetical protein
VRLTYCNHLFHKDCLSGWFAKTQVYKNIKYRTVRIVDKILIEKIQRNYIKMF